MEKNFTPEQKVKEFMGLSEEARNDILLDELTNIQKQEAENEKKFSEMEKDLFTKDIELRKSYEGILKNMIIQKEQMNILRKEIYDLLDLVNKEKIFPDTDSK
jgi:hypothetical protein